MAYLRFLFLCGLLVLPTRAQLSGQAYPQFELRADPPSPRTQIVAGYLPSSRNSSQATAVGHRYFYDATAHTYFGYDIVIRRDQPGGARYNVLYYDLSIGPLDFADGPADALNPTLWKKLPLPTPMAWHAIRSGETREDVVSVDPSTGQKLIDSMYLAPAMQPASAPSAPVNLQQLQFRTSSSTPRQVAFRGAGVVSPGDFTVPFVSGTARDFSADDAEMTIQEARITFNDVRQELASTVRHVSGSLLWFYVPGHGRYVLSLLPRPDLGFVKAGEIRGGAVSFTLGADRVQLESPNAIAPGRVPYIVYVVHDAAWFPTAQTQSGIMLMGTVSTGELAALNRK